MWEAFLSGAMVMVDAMAVPDMMPYPPQHGKHWVVYNQSNPDHFKKKLAYYTDPANAAETEAIAKAGYEFVVRHHMPVDRVEYLLKSDKVRAVLEKTVKNAATRKIILDLY